MRHERCRCCHARVTGPTCDGCGPVGTYDPAALGLEDYRACEGRGWTGETATAACAVCKGRGMVIRAADAA